MSLRLTGKSSFYIPGIDTDLWVGGSDTKNEGDWEWENGDPVPIGIPFWHPLQPDGGYLENKLVFAHNGFFADGHEEMKYGYICQYVGLLNVPEWDDSDATVVTGGKKS